MPIQHVHSNIKQSAISVVVTRADGTVEDLGVVSYYHRNPLKRLMHALRRRLGHHINDSDYFAQA